MSLDICKIYPTDLIKNYDYVMLFVTLFSPIQSLSNFFRAKAEPCFIFSKNMKVYSLEVACKR